MCQASQKGFVRLFCTAYAQDDVGTPESRSEQASAKKGSFEKVGECLYRYTPNGTYYARVEKEGKEFRRSLRTNDRALAKRKLADFQREIGRTLPGANRTTVAQLADMYLLHAAALGEKHPGGQKPGHPPDQGLMAGRQQSVDRQGSPPRTSKAGCRAREASVAPAA